MFEGGTNIEASPVCPALAKSIHQSHHHHIPTIPRLKLGVPHRVFCFKKVQIRRRSIYFYTPIKRNSAPLNFTFGSVSFRMARFFVSLTKIRGCYYVHWKKFCFFLFFFIHLPFGPKVQHNDANASFLPQERCCCRTAAWLVVVGCAVFFSTTWIYPPQLPEPSTCHSILVNLTYNL